MHSNAQESRTTPLDIPILTQSSGCESASDAKHKQGLLKDPSHADVENTLVASGPDWLLDSALGRWLGSTHLAFTNLTLLKVLLWLVLLGLFVELEFGFPFFLISLFFWIYEGLRKPTARKPGELSAYSVFNPDCQPILGSLTAEQLEGEMGYRPLANR
ncbi:SAYSvFN domain-containing protein 1 [Aplochiton taeniatus]